MTSFFIAHIIPGILLFAIGYVGESPAACVALISIAFGFNGASSVTNLQNVHDFAPNYAATIFSLANIFGTTSGFVAPLVVAFFTREKVCCITRNFQILNSDLSNYFSRCQISEHRSRMELYFFNCKHFLYFAGFIFHLIW